MGLDLLAIKHGNDKSSRHHNYCEKYERHIPFVPGYGEWKMLVIGVGGYHHPDRGGSDLLMFNEYFHGSVHINAIDIHPKPGLTWPKGSNIKTHVCDQSIPDQLRALIDEIGPQDVIIDDGSHINEDVILTFSLLFRHLNPGGVYFIEDIETSWWEAPGADGTVFGGTFNSSDYQASTSVNMGRWLVNEVNHKRIHQFKRTHAIESIHFYDNMIVIHKER